MPPYTPTLTWEQMQVVNYVNALGWSWPVSIGIPHIQAYYNAAKPLIGIISSTLEARFNSWWNSFKIRAEETTPDEYTEQEFDDAMRQAALDAYDDIKGEEDPETLGEFLAQFPLFEEGG